MSRVVRSSTARPTRLAVTAVISVLILSAAFLSFSAAGAASQDRPAATPDTDDPCAAIVAAGTPAVLGGGDGDPGAAGTIPAGTSGEPGDPADYPFDLVFIDAMMAHHDAAILTAQIALVRAEHEELRELARAIVDQQATEIEQMRAWRTAWYGDAAPVPTNVTTGLMDEGLMLVGSPADTGMGGPATGAGTDAARLCTATDAFDLAVIAQMIPHHQGAVGVALLARERAEHPEVRALAEEIIATRQAEIGQMTEWQIAWSAESAGTPAATGQVG